MLTIKSINQRFPKLNYKSQFSIYSKEETILLDMMYPFFTMVFYCIVVSYAYDSTNIIQWIIGNAFLLCTNTCIFLMGGSFVGERVYGRLRTILVAPISLLEFIIEKSIVSCALCIVTTSLGFLGGCLLFGVPLYGFPWGGLIVILLFSMASASSFGLMMSSVGVISD